MDRFTDDQIARLRAPLPGSAVHTVKRGGRDAEYVRGDYVINVANDIFGFDGWRSEILGLQCVESSQQGNANYEGRDKAGYLVAYTARVRVTVRVGGAEHSHEDAGYGEGIDYANVGQAHESAVKEAVTDALKRALRHWGNQFGLSLYDRDRDRTPERAPRAPQPRQAGTDGAAKPMVAAGATDGEVEMSKEQFREVQEARARARVPDADWRRIWAGALGGETKPKVRHVDAVMKAIADWKPEA